jgi:hypothetical protein
MLEKIDTSNVSKYARLRPNKDACSLPIYKKILNCDDIRNHIFSFLMSPDPSALIKIRLVSKVFKRQVDETIKHELRSIINTNKGKSYWPFYAWHALISSPSFKKIDKLATIANARKELSKKFIFFYEKKASPVSFCNQNASKIAIEEAINRIFLSDDNDDNEVVGIDCSEYFQAEKNRIIEKFLDMHKNGQIINNCSENLSFVFGSLGLFSFISSFFPLINISNVVNLYLMVVLEIVAFLSCLLALFLNFFQLSRRDAISRGLQRAAQFVRQDRLPIPQSSFFESVSNSKTSTEQKEQDLSTGSEEEKSHIQIDLV